MASARTVLVTGASTGIGRAACLDLAARGWRVFGSVRREQDAGAFAAATPAGSIAMTPLRFDVTDRAAIDQAKDELQDMLQGERLHALVNNAGVAIGGPLAYLPMADFERQIAINLTGVLHCTQAFLPLMRGGPSRLVQVSSIAGKVGFPLLGPYHASKHGLEGMSDCLRMELKHLGVDVVLIEPGPVKSQVWQTAKSHAAEAEKRLPAQAREDFGRMMTQVAKAAAKSEQNGVPAQECAKVIRRALESSRPRTRYVVGRPGKLLLFLRRWFLSDRMTDRMVLKSLKL
jgi:NAD(P)-dependent dehydrogenase (short-subunit alcohol dehydrogenase family)